MNSGVHDTSSVAIEDSLFVRLARHAVVAFLGAVFAVILYKIWSLDGRWFYVSIAALIMLSVAGFSAPRFSDFLMMLLMFCLPLAGFSKWLFVGGYDADVVANQVYAGLISIGIYEFLLAGLYMSWFFRVFVTREQRTSPLTSMDYWVLALILAYLASIPGSIEPSFGLFSTGHLLKYAAIYFYVTRNFQYAHVKWFLVAMIVAIFLNTLLGAYQKLTGNLIGIALDKGAGGSELNTAYEVYGLESTRSTGMTYDSHTLGMFMGMVIQFTLALLMWPKMRFFHKTVAIVVLSMAVLTLFFAYSRTAWLSTLIASGLLMAVMFFRWRSTKVLTYIGIGLVVVLIMSPWLFEYIYDRFDRGTSEVLGYRYDQWVFAVDVWLRKPIFGHGAGNYMEAMQTIQDFGNSSPLPVHNMYLWILCDTGIVGAVVFFGMILTAMKRFWAMAKNNQTLISCMSLAIFMSFIVFLLDGITNPIFREPSIYTLFWFYMAFASIFPVFHKMELEGTLRPDTQITSL